MGVLKTCSCLFAPVPWAQSMPTSSKNLGWAVTILQQEIYTPKDAVGPTLLCAADILLGCFTQSPWVMVLLVVCRDHFTVHELSSWVSLKLHLVNDALRFFWHTMKHVVLLVNGNNGRVAFCLSVRPHRHFKKKLLLSSGVAVLRAYNKDKAGEHKHSIFPSFALSLMAGADTWHMPLFRAVAVVVVHYWEEKDGAVVEVAGSWRS